MKFLLKKNAVMLVLAGIISMVAGIGLKTYFFFNPAPETIRERIQHDESTGRINILLVGLDEVPGEAANRSDSISFVSIDIDDKIIRLLSLPRDTRVQITDHGWQKLNHAYAYGGVELLENTLVNYLGVPIQYYVIVNFESFPQLVDMIGGITIDVPKQLHYTDRAGSLYIDIPAGKQHMDGKTALGFVRFRHDALGDIGRVERQQIFLRSVFEKIKEPSIIPKIPELIHQSMKLVKTNMTISQSIQLASYLKDQDPSRTVFRTLPGRAAYISGVSYWLGELSSISEILSEKPINDISTSSSVDAELNHPISELLGAITVPVAVLNGSGSPGIGKEAATRLQSIGIDVAYIGNAKHFDYKYTNILFPPGDDTEHAAKALGKIAMIQNSLIGQDRNARHVTIIFGHDYVNILKQLNISN